VDTGSLSGPCDGVRICPEIGDHMSNFGEPFLPGFAAIRGIRAPGPVFVAWRPPNFEKWKPTVRKGYRETFSLLIELDPRVPILTKPLDGAHNCGEIWNEFCQKLCIYYEGLRDACGVTVCKFEFVWYMLLAYLSYLGVEAPVGVIPPWNMFIPTVFTPYFRTGLCPVQGTGLRRCCFSYPIPIYTWLDHWKTSRWKVLGERQLADFAMLSAQLSSLQCCVPLFAIPKIPAYCSEDVAENYHLLVDSCSCGALCGFYCLDAVCDSWDISRYYALRGDGPDYVSLFG